MLRENLLEKIYFFTKYLIKRKIVKAWIFIDIEYVTITRDINNSIQNLRVNFWD